MLYVIVISFELNISFLPQITCLKFRFSSHPSKVVVVYNFLPPCAIKVDVLTGKKNSFGRSH